MQPDPITHLWMHEQELGRTMKQNALERAARDADKPAARYRASLRERIAAGSRDAVHLREYRRCPRLEHPWASSALRRARRQP